ncbi:MAG: hypothetical protein LBR22_00725 [Desulfovibrio sp.]|jgi:hypothetical protein|nr:hypothetical protein [Desulfovibrio sp.]
MNTLLFTPAARERVLATADDTRYILTIPSSQVTVCRPDGTDDLTLTLTGNRTIELAGFYSIFDEDNLPEFELNGKLFAGADFITAFCPAELSQAAA